MGIRYLNGWLKNECKEAISEIHFSELKYKKIAIDTSIYMYKFMGENNLLENMYLLISLLRFYHIVPLFIFDGKPPDEKKELLAERKKTKLAAKENYYEMMDLLEECSDPNEKKKLLEKIEDEKKKFVHLTNYHINLVKELMDLYGVSYCQAHGEADTLCAKLVQKKKVWGCISEDTDLFVYGCSRVYRYLNLNKQSLVMYETKKILKTLNIRQEEFREICVLAGTDYNIGTSFTLPKTVKLYEKFKKNKDKDKEGFYPWLEKTNVIQDYTKLINTYFMFDLSGNSIPSDVFNIHNRAISTTKLQAFMKEHCRFIYI